MDDILTVSYIAQITGIRVADIIEELEPTMGGEIDSSTTLSLQKVSEWLKSRDLDYEFTLLKDHPNAIFYSQYMSTSIRRSWKRDNWKNRKIKRELNFIDLFAGAGGFSLGFIMAGYRPLDYLEYDKYAVQTYERNFSWLLSTLNGAKDITDTSVKEEFIDRHRDADVDAILGGFPCQGFSLAGQRVVLDPRNTLYKDMLEIVDGIRPKVVVMENVYGLLTMLDGKVIEKIIVDYRNIGYDVSYEVLDAADFGVAQRRKRVILIGNRQNKINLFPYPIFNKEDYQTVGQRLEEFLDWEESIELNHVFSKHSSEMQRRLAAVPQGGNLYPSYSDSWRKSPWDKPSCTIKENHGATNIHPRRARVITVREAAALQSFPNDFIFSGAKKHQLVQVGNAVPPLMSKAIALAIKGQL